MTVAITREALIENGAVLLIALERVGGKASIEACPDGGTYRDRVLRSESRQPGDEECLVHLTPIA